MSAVVIHHTSKDERKKVLQRVSGTHGFTGAVDTVLVLTKDALTKSKEDALNEDEAILHVIGREVEAQDLLLKYDPETGGWKCLGTAGFYLMGDERKEIYDYIAANPDATPKQVADALRKNYNTTKNLMRAMFFGEMLRSNGRGGDRGAQKTV